MTEDLQYLLGPNGAFILFLITFASCIGVPIPAGLVILGAGALVSLGPDTAFPFLAAAYLGAILGGVLIFMAGRFGGALLVNRVSERPALGDLLERAEQMVARRGGIAVFLGSWLVAQVGPALTLISGAGRLDWRVFAAWYLSGRLIWAVGYFALGYVFSDQLALVAELLGTMSRGVLGVVVLVVAAIAATHYLRRRSS